MVWFWRVFFFFVCFHELLTQSCLHTHSSPASILLTSPISSLHKYFSPKPRAVHSKSESIASCSTDDASNKTAKPGAFPCSVCQAQLCSKTNHVPQPSSWCARGGLEQSLFQGGTGAMLCPAVTAVPCMPNVELWAGSRSKAHTTVPWDSRPKRHSAWKQSLDSIWSLK